MGVLLMLMTIGGLIVAAILLVISFFTKQIWLQKSRFGRRSDCGLFSTSLCCSVFR